jgi:hypothetical protein
MKSYFRRTLAAACAISTLATADDVDVKHESTRIGAWIDAGQIWQGEVDFNEEVEKQVVTRSKVALTQSATINEKLVLTGAVGGLFYYSLPVLPSGPHTRLTKFTAVLEEASAHYKFGDLETPWAETKFGLFFQKYNPDAKNLGEYLFRSGAYPGYLQTGGWYILNNAGYFLQGVRASFNLFDGALRPEALLYMERDWEPTYDLSSALMLTFRKPAFEVGAGVAFAHMLPAKGSLTTPKKRVNASYKTPTGKDTLFTIDQLTDTTFNPPTTYYTFQGTKLMARASFNIQALLQAEILNPEDLKIYAEVGVLGVKNYPVYYTDITKRMPMMVGFNFPTFKLVEKASFELEYYNSDFPNSLDDVYQQTFAIPGLGNQEDRQKYINNLGTQRKLRDKVKWSFWLQESITPGLGLFLQVASDHFRPMDYNLKPTYQPVTQNWNDWYYMVRLNFGI